MKKFAVDRLEILLLMAGAALADTGAFDNQSVHPGFIVSQVNLGIGNVSTMGLGWLSNGDMVLVTCQSTNGYGIGVPGVQNSNAAVYLVSNITTSPSARKIASNFYQPSGVAIGVNDEIMIPDRDAIYKVSLTGNKIKVLDNPMPLAWHQWVFCPMYFNGRYYAPYAGSILQNGGGWSATNPTSSYSGAMLSWSSDGSDGFQKFAGGFRCPNGAGLGSGLQAGFMMVADNQGSYEPSCSVNLIRSNRFYGHKQQTGFTANWAQAANASGDMPYDPPIAWMLDGENSGGGVSGGGGAGQSTSQPLYMDRGPYAGDWIVADVNQMGISRISLDPVNGGTGLSANYNGSVSWFTNGFGNGAPNRMIWHPTEKIIYVGTIGTLGNWPSSNAQPFYQIAFDDAKIQSAFEVLSVKSRQDGIEILFSQPLYAEAAVPANFIILGQFHINRQDAYGKGNDVSPKPIVGAVELSHDKKRVFLQIGNQAGTDRVLVLNMPNIQSATHANLVFARVWFTHNYQSTVAFNPTGVTTVSKRVKVDPFLAGHVSLRMLQSRLLEVKTDLIGPYTVSLRTMNGKRLEKKSGVRPAEFKFRSAFRGIAILEVHQGGHHYVSPVMF